MRAGPPQRAEHGSALHSQSPTSGPVGSCGAPTMDQPLHRPLKGRNILVVEDDPFIALDLQGVLEAAGATVVGSRSRSFRGLEPRRKIGDMRSCSRLSSSSGRHASLGTRVSRARHTISVSDQRSDRRCAQAPGCEDPPETFPAAPTLVGGRSLVSGSVRPYIVVD